MILKTETTVKLAKKEVTSNYLGLSVSSVNSQQINVRVTDLLKGTKLSAWEDVSPGSNDINIDLTTLPKGFYRVLVTMDKGKVFFEDFTRH